MRVEVDQSGRIDQTDRATVVAFANGEQFSIRLSPRAKRQILDELRPKWKGKHEPKTLYIVVFATLLYLLFKERINQLEQVVIDTEFTGHEGTIKDHVLNLLRRKGLHVESDTFMFMEIGKKSSAHDLALKVYQGKIAPDHEITVEEILAEFK
jgi:hypothetical protein